MLNIRSRVRVRVRVLAGVGLAQGRVSQRGRVRRRNCRPQTPLWIFPTKMSGVRNYRNSRYPNKYWRNVPAYGLTALSATLGQHDAGQWYTKGYDRYFNATKEFDSTDWSNPKKMHVRRTRRPASHRTRRAPVRSRRRVSYAPRRRIAVRRRRR